jgi:L-lactate permease
MQLSFLTWILALLPVIVVLVLMLLLRWGGSKAGAVSVVRRHCRGNAVFWCRPAPDRLFTS